jgi:DNA-directed RNA polymerase subunit K/omega
MISKTKTHNPMAIQSSVVTRDVEKITAPSGNIYESVVIISKRARQIAVNMKEELNNKLAEFATTVDNLEEVFENREQIEISKFYERMPKPTSTATEEFLEGKLSFRSRNEIEEKPEL